MNLINNKIIMNNNIFVNTDDSLKGELFTGPTISLLTIHLYITKNLACKIKLEQMIVTLWVLFHPISLII